MAAWSCYGAGMVVIAESNGQPDNLRNSPAAPSALLLGAVRFLQRERRGGLLPFFLLLVDV